MTNSNKTEQLKSEGNTFFTQKNYAAAIRKYSEAINLDGTNAVLYCNRAACHQVLQAYNDAILDAQASTRLDPLYSKAWTRLARAEEVLSADLQAVQSWERALATLPSDNPNSSELKQREEYKAALDAVRRRLAASEVKFVNFTGKKRPAERALELITELHAQHKWTSSAWAIAQAQDNFDKSYTWMSLVKTVPTPEGNTTFVGRTGAIDSMSNAIMMDNRCFAIKDHRFQEKFSKQAHMELLKNNAPVADMYDVNKVTHAFLRLHEQGSWSLVRPAIGVVVRVILLRAFIEGGVNGTAADSVKLYDKILAIQGWGRKKWANVPRESRGTVFDDTFVRGVRALRLESYLTAWSKKQNRGQITLEGLSQEADELLEDIRANPAPPFDVHTAPGFGHAFWHYIEGQALTAKGFCWNQTALAELRQNQTHEAAFASFRKSGECYLEGASKYPEDDERNVHYTSVGLEMLFSAGAPLRETLPVMERIRTLVPIQHRIWENSQISLEGVAQRYKEIESFERGVPEGASLDEKIVPEFIMQTLAAKMQEVE